MAAGARRFDQRALFVLANKGDEQRRIVGDARAWRFPRLTGRERNGREWRSELRGRVVNRDSSHSRNEEMRPRRRATQPDKFAQPWADRERRSRKHYDHEKSRD